MHAVISRRSRPTSSIDFSSSGPWTDTNRGFPLVVPPPGFDGPGPNPLLQNHILMAFHPPILYLGYVGFTVPFMFAKDEVPGKPDPFDPLRYLGRLRSFVNRRAGDAVRTLKITIAYDGGPPLGDPPSWRVAWFTSAALRALLQ